MRHRRALLIGAATYGDGFAALPAVCNDLALMEVALKQCGYETTVLSEDETANASVLDQRIRGFSSLATRDDLHLIYFSGHGMILGNQDCIIPARSRFADVVSSPAQRVSTDLSTAMRGDDPGLVVFIVDACRAEKHRVIGKSGGGEWGDPDHVAVPSENRFVRFFGCSSGQLCHVLEDGGDGKPVSVFSKSLAEILSSGQASTLQDILHAAEKRCRDLSNSRSLPLQTPRLSCGETSQAYHAVAESPPLR